MSRRPPAWSAQLTLAQPQNGLRLAGDKILLPSSALQQLLAVYTEPTQHMPHFDPFNSSGFSTFRQTESQFEDHANQLPRPLTFRLVNPKNERAVYAGVREFSSEDGQVVVSPFLLEALGIPETDLEETGQIITVHAQQLPKGTYVKLRPLEAGYDPADWKSLLEQHLRSNFTTLTNKEILSVSSRGSNAKSQVFKFLVDGFQPESDGVSVIDTDLEVDIEALNEEQARETLKSIAEKLHRTETQQGSSHGGVIDIFTAKDGQVLPSEYVDYELSAWDRSQALDIELVAGDEDESLNLLISPLSSAQRARPREDEHILADLDSRPTKRIRLEPSNIALSDAEALYMSVQAYGDDSVSEKSTARAFSLRVKHTDTQTTSSDQQSAHDGEVQCKNCLQWIPKQSLVLHENFCLRNNILCPKGCGQVFQRRSPAYQNHWHCVHDSEFGNSSVSLHKHNHLYHPSNPLHCPDCSTKETFSSIPALAQHRTSTCPAKLILCRFCHLEVPQEGDPDLPSAEVLLTGMTQHELLDGARTTECHLCGKIVRLRDMDLHLKAHDLDRHSRAPPRPCRNVNCGRTLDTAAKNGDTRAGTRMAQGNGNDIGLCSSCFGPLYVSLHDPEGKALRRRVERRYLQQLVTAPCGKGWCQNEYCKTGRSHLRLESPPSMKEGMQMVKTFVDNSTNPVSGSPLHFCVDKASQTWRQLAAMLATEDSGPVGNGGYTFEWCVGALEAESGDVDAARQWLKHWAPTRNEA